MGAEEGTEYGGYTRVRRLHSRDKVGIPRELPISTVEDFSKAQGIAHAYAKSYIAEDYKKQTFENLGREVGIDYQFKDRRSGCNTIGGQVRELDNSERRDCKLPSFLFAVACAELFTDVEIVYKLTNTAHPIIHATIDGEHVFGHFVKPKPSDPDPHSEFELFSETLKEKYLDRIIRGDLIRVKPDLIGMQRIDEAFVKDSKEPLVDI